MSYRRYRLGSYQEMRDQHRWEVPERYNIAADVCDKHPRDRLAMVWEDWRGNERQVSFGELQDLSAKFAPPVPAGLARSRLLDLAAHRVVLVLAPAGHGKTTLLGQIASRFPGPVVWYRIDAADRDPDELAGRIGRALGRVGVGDAACRSFDDVAAALDTTGLDTAGREMLLVFDDFHAVAGSAAEHGLARMIALAPPTLRVVLGARRVVGLDVSALRVYGADVRALAASADGAQLATREGWGLALWCR